MRTWNFPDILNDLIIRIHTNLKILSVLLTLQYKSSNPLWPLAAMRAKNKKKVGLCGRLSRWQMLLAQALRATEPGQLRTVENVRCMLVCVCVCVRMCTLQYKSISVSQPS